ncbi:MAG: NADH-quinone oxidoreductase subunit N [Verrucomicrobiales bacterium]
MPAYYLEIATVALGLVLLMLEAFLEKVDKRTIGWIALVGLLGIFLAATVFVQEAPDAANCGFYCADKLALFYKKLSLVAAIIVIIMGMEFTPVLSRYLAGEGKQGGIGEFFCLPVFVTAGLMLMASANDLLAIFVALELVTISFYILVAYMRRNVGSLEAGVKYLILGALSTGFFVYGVAWIFGVTGQTDLAKIGEVLHQLPEGTKLATFFAFALLLVGLGFKIAAVPFQIWVPDVYQGAPTPVTAFLSVGSKAAGFIVLIRVLQPFLGAEATAEQVRSILLVVAGATIIYGNFAAIAQTNSSGCSPTPAFRTSASPPRSRQRRAEELHLLGRRWFSTSATYLLMTLAAFLVLTAIRVHLGGDELSNSTGFAKRSPFAFAMVVSSVSLAGVPTAGSSASSSSSPPPPTTGISARCSSSLPLVLPPVSITTSRSSALMFSGTTQNPETPVLISGVARNALGVLVAGILILGVYPKPILAMLP